MKERNIFEEFQQGKNKVRNLADAALEKGWLLQDDYDEIINKLENDTLTIGVIGQMKCGKSTFLNAFIFNDTVLPAATNPMTAALSIITYGKEKNIVAEFYSKDEWANLKMQAERQLGEKPSIDEINVKQAAMEIYNKSQIIANEIPSLLGQSKTDRFENLIDYVGADGKYVLITKSVTIHYPVEWLKGVEIVDTPGFNDPIVSRELRTQEFLRKADVVLMLLYAGRAFDVMDRNIIFEKVRKVGIGKILLGVNMYDLLIEKESEEEIIANVEEMIRKTCRDPKYRDDVLIQEAMRDIKPILLSAKMALMAKMPLNKVFNDPDLKFHFDKSCQTFGNLKQDQQQMLKDSLIGNLEDAVRSLIERSKADILIKKPTNHIFQLANNKKEELETAIKADTNTLKELKSPDTELEDRLINLKRAQKRIERRIERTITELSNTFDEISESGIKEMKTIVMDAMGDCLRISGSAKRHEVGSKLNSRIKILNTIQLPDAKTEYNNRFVMTLSRKCEDFANEVVEQLESCVDDCEGIIDTFLSAVNMGVNSIKDGARNEDFDVFEGDFMNITLKAVFEDDNYEVGDILTCLSDEWRAHYNARVEEHFKKYNFKSLQEDMMVRKPEYLKLLRTESTSKLLVELVDKLTAALESKENKEKLILQTESSLENNKRNLSELETQISELKSLVN